MIFAYVAIVALALTVIGCVIIIALGDCDDGSDEYELRERWRCTGVLGLIIIVGVLIAGLVFSHGP